VCAIHIEPKNRSREKSQAYREWVEIESVVVAEQSTKLVSVFENVAGRVEVASLSWTSLANEE
jgi:hypothetical protein